MNPLMLPRLGKNQHPVLTAVMLVAVGSAIIFVLYMMIRHHVHTRRAKKRGHSPHTGHHGNH